MLTLVALLAVLTLLGRVGVVALLLAVDGLLAGSPGGVAAHDRHVRIVVLRGFVLALLPVTVVRAVWRLGAHRVTSLRVRMRYT